MLSLHGCSARDAVVRKAGIQIFIVPHRRELGD
jgi:hypothetical protein